MTARTARFFVKGEIEDDEEEPPYEEFESDLYRTVGLDVVFVLGPSCGLPRRARASCSERAGHDSAWRPVGSAFSKCRNPYHEPVIKLAGAQVLRRTMQVVLRAYDDGMAFRYTFAKQTRLTMIDFDQEFSAVSKALFAGCAVTAHWGAGKVPYELLAPDAFTKKLCRSFTIQLAPDCLASCPEMVDADDHYLWPERCLIARTLQVPSEPVEIRRGRYQVRKKQVHKGDMIHATIAPDGGHCMWIRAA